MQNNLQLNIYVLSFTLPEYVIKPNDDVRVSITTLPEQVKQNFTIPAREMLHPRHAFQAGITQNTQKIIFVFRKKSFLDGDPIIASTTLNAKDFPKIILRPNEIDECPVQTLNIYEPIHHGNDVIPFGLHIIDHRTHRNILGQIQFKALLFEQIANTGFHVNRKAGHPAPVGFHKNFEDTPNENVGNGFVDPLYC